MMAWQTQEAKARFSELIKMAEHAPQFITARGKPAAVVISQKEFLRLSEPKPPFFDFMQTSPLAATNDLDLERDSSLPREPEN
ncbi:MAG: type II toxin-antitoxin system Phd/YefM family antitoxin [Synergistaceae bacterium]|jgi:prevent-host-death family protein|nr:type II toxin-antitoxin system Phd/YefM family antitoxin [Synergistaceae bacterium]